MIHLVVRLELERVTGLGVCLAVCPCPLQPPPAGTGGQGTGPSVQSDAGRRLTHPPTVIDTLSSSILTSPHLTSPSHPQSRLRPPPLSSQSLFPFHPTSPSTEAPRSRCPAAPKLGTRNKNSSRDRHRAHLLLQARRRSFSLPSCPSTPSQFPHLPTSQPTRPRLSHSPSSRAELLPRRPTAT